MFIENCDWLKSNEEKDAPKKMNLVIVKKTYLPISMKLKRATVTMHDMSYGGVTEEMVTFDAKDYPDVKIIDNR